MLWLRTVVELLSVGGETRILSVSSRSANFSDFDQICLPFDPYGATFTRNRLHPYRLYFTNTFYIFLH